MALENLVDGMTGLQMANALKNNFDKVLNAESEENKAENAGLSIKTDYDATRYIDLQLADGTPVKMKMDVFCQAIAPVVAGQMGNPAGYKGDKSNIDANTITSSGLYYLNGGITNALEWSYLMVFSFGSANDVVQINTHNSENLTKIRKCAGGTWSSWKEL